MYDTYEVSNLMGSIREFETIELAYKWIEELLENGCDSEFITLSKVTRTEIKR